MIAIIQRVGSACCIAGLIDDTVSIPACVSARLLHTGMSKPRWRISRNAENFSITIGKGRPDLTLIVEDTCLLVGEDKPLSGDMKQAEADLMMKCTSYWDLYYGSGTEDDSVRFSVGSLFGSHLMHILPLCGHAAHACYALPEIPLLPKQSV